MELQQRRAELERAGIAIFAISYDPVSVLASFAGRQAVSTELWDAA